MMQVKIRFALGQDANTGHDEVRRFVMPETFDKLREKIAAVSGCTAFVVRYVDDDGDKVTMSTQEEFELAVGLARVAVPPVLRLEVTAPGSAAALALAPAASAAASSAAAAANSTKQRDDDFVMPPRKVLMGRYVSATVADGAVFPPNTAFVQKFRFRNDAAAAWPVGCRLLFVGGLDADKMSDAPWHYANASEVVAPGAEIEVALPLVSPAKPGKYIGYWRLTTPDGAKFGQRVWVQIVVAEPAAAAASGADVIPTAAPVAVAAAAAAPVLVTSDKDVWAEKLAQLAALGFGEHEHRNKRMLIRHNGDVNAVAAKLAAGGRGASESAEHSDHPRRHGHGFHGFHHGFHHGHHGHRGQGWMARRGVDAAVAQILAQVPHKARELPTDEKLDFLAAHGVGTTREANRAALDAHDGRLKRTIIALAVQRSD